MIVVHGVNRFGHIDEVHGQYLVTRFVHVLGLPLIPTGSEWITGITDGAFTGVRCRLSGRSVGAAYVRRWGALASITCAVIAMASSPLWYAPSALALAAAIVSWRRRHLRDPRELRRVALQHDVFGAAVDPARLRRAHAVELLRAAEERFAATGDGRTAADVARDGGTTPEQAARAFVVLRLAAAGAPRAARADALAASDRILDGTVAATALDGPYRQAQRPAIAAPAAAPGFEPQQLRPHTSHFVLATLAAWIGAGYLVMRPQLAKCMCGERKDTIALAGARQLAAVAYPRWRRDHPDAPCPTVAALAEYTGAARDPWGTPYRIRCISPTFAIAWSTGEDKTDGTGDDVGSWR